nr:PREDICTED: collagen alpha-1(XXVI) chain-like [Latimeria chalumnae]|eukprot:XP_014352909.1 PREDICTED: collagen alpha-1(XXVI) chain-like [Latimeria chalumnae]
MKLLLLLLCFRYFFEFTSGTGFLYQFPAAALQHSNPEQSAGHPATGYPNRRNWCPYVVTKTVSCQVQNGSETLVQRVYQSCRWPGPCANLVRTLIRPTYKVSYRTVTGLEWKCCPGFKGSNCEEVGLLLEKTNSLTVYGIIEFCTNIDVMCCTIYQRNQCNKSS